MPLLHYVDSLEVGSKTSKESKKLRFVLSFSQWPMVMEHKSNNDDVMCREAHTVAVTRYGGVLEAGEQRGALSPEFLNST